MSNEKTIYDDITDLLDGNGKLDAEVRGRYTLIALREIGRDLKGLKVLEAKVEKLERHSVIFFMQKYPKTSAIIVVSIFVLLNAWFVSAFRQTILQLLGLPKDLIP